MNSAAAVASPVVPDGVVPGDHDPRHAPQGAVDVLRVQVPHLAFGDGRHGVGVGVDLRGLHDGPADDRDVLLERRFGLLLDVGLRLLRVLRPGRDHSEYQKDPGHRENPGSSHRLPPPCPASHTLAELIASWPCLTPLRPIRCSEM